MIQFKGTNVKDMNKELLEASMYGDLEKLKNLFESGDATIHDDYVLSAAAYFGNLEIIKYLIGQGFDIHSSNDEALRWTVKNGHIEVVLYLRNLAGDKWKCHDCIVSPMCLKLCEGWNNGYTQTSA